MLVKLVVKTVFNRNEVSLCLEAFGSDVMS